MKYEKETLFFSGFSFQDESELFKEYLSDSPFSVSGFSYGTIKAFEYTLSCEKRVDTLQLFSPAFFQTKGSPYKRAQLLYYKKDKRAYISEFLKNASYPAAISLEKYLADSDEHTLKILLEYQWEKEKIEKVLQRGTKIELHLGKLDKITDAKEALDFFKPYATIFFYNNYGHLLKGNC